MTIHDLTELTWEEVDGLDRTRVVPILPAGAIEAHGPHLPLNTDVLIAEAMARAGAERLAARGLVPLLLPPLVYSTAGFAADFSGTLSPDPAAVTASILGIGRSLGLHGFSLLAIANAHLDPAHLGAIVAAVARIQEEGLVRVAFPDLTRKPWVSRLTEEFRTGACHAGRFETSLVLAIRPDLVHQDLQRELPPNPSSLSVAIRGGLSTFEEAGGPRAYFGWPADATPEEGQESLATLAAILEEAVLNERPR